MTQQADLPPKDVETGDPLPGDDFGGGPDVDLSTTSPSAAPVEDDQYQSYWGFNITDTWFFPDGKQYITFKKLTEGERSKYQMQVNRDITVERTSGNARMRVDQATDRHALLSQAVTGWNLKRLNNGTWLDVPFSKGSPGANFEQWLQVADPGLVNELEKAVRKLNPWLTNELSVSELDEMIADLQQQREDAVKREAGN